MYTRPSPSFFASLLAAIPAQGGLVAAHIELLADEVREEIVVETGQEFDGPRVHGVQHHRVCGVFREILVFIVPQPSPQVGHRVLIRHQFDEAVPAIGVQGFDFPRRSWARSPSIPSRVRHRRRCVRCITGFH